MLMPQKSCLGDHRNLPFPEVSHRLPAELLASIFIRIARDSYINSKYSYCTPTAPSWVNVSCVCRYWRDVALNFPTLWSYIPPTSQRWTQELLARSQMAPLKLSSKDTSAKSRDWYYPPEELKAQVLSIVVQVMNHSQRIQKLRLDFYIVSEESGYQILSKFLSTRLPCLQHLNISHFNIPKGKSWLLLEEDTPALRTLRLNRCSMPWYAVRSSALTTLHLSCVGRVVIPENTMAEFLAILRRMPNLVQLSVDNALPSIHDFMSNGKFDAIPTISLPHLSNMSIVMAPLSAATALLSCVDIPLRTKVHLEVELEYYTSKHISTLDCIRLASLLGQRISQSDSPNFRSLTIASQRRIALAFSTSERAECIGSDDSAFLKVIICSVNRPISDKLSCSILSGICSQIPLTNIKSVHFLGPSLDPEFWRDMLALLSDVRHIIFSQDQMPNITSMLFLPSHPLTRNWQDGRADGDVENEIFLPALEELELYKTTLKRVHGRSGPPSYRDIADVQALYDAIATRKETRCRLIIKECRLFTVEAKRTVEAMDSVGWWEGTEFRVTSKV